jgi:hypothetical protein
MSILRAQASLSKVLNDVFTDFLAAVAGLTPQPVMVFGPKDSEAQLNPPGVFWSPGDEAWSAPQRHGKPGEPSTLWVREIPLSFLVFGGENAAADYDAERGGSEAPSTSMNETDVTEALVEHLVNALHRRLSQHGYQITGGSWGEGAREGIGLAFELGVTLRLPLARLDNPVVTLEGIRPTVRLPSDT